MFEQHDCSNCSEQGRCGIEAITTWLEEHSDEVSKCMEETANQVAQEMQRLINVFPPLLMVSDALAVMARHAFLLGLHKGRTRQVLPETYNKW